MNPVRRMNSLILALTSTTVFSILISFTDYLSKNTSKLKIINENKILSIFFTLIFSIGFYNAVMTVFKIWFNNCTWLKKKILGSMYLEGHWVGYFIGKNKRPRIFYETIEQELDKIIIRGTSFNDDGSYHASWVSNNVFFNTEEGKITYYYENDTINNTHINPGIGSFNVKRDASKLAPYELIGYTSDLFNPGKVSSIECKVINNKELSTCELFEKGKEVKKKYNDLNK